MSPQQLLRHQSIDLSILGDRIRRHRRAAMLSQNEVGEAAGVAGSYLSRVENGDRRPSADLLHRVAAVLGVDVDALLFGSSTVSAEEVATAAAAWLAQPGEAGAYARLVELVRGWDAASAEGAVAQTSPAGARASAGL